MTPAPPTPTPPAPAGGKSTEGPRFELFHAIGDDSSARVRRWVVDHELLPHVRFRNVSYPEVRADLTARGGWSTPALWDGAVLVSGADAVIALLDAFRDVGR